MTKPTSVVELVEMARKRESGDFSADLKYIKDLVGTDIMVRGEYIEGNRRVILTTKRSSIDMGHRGSFRCIGLYRECSGLVLEWPTWKILCKPPPILYNKFRKVNLVGLIPTKYDIYEICDGTTVTLYWWNDAWRMSSMNGYDVSGYKWIGPLTYREALDDTLTRCGYNDFWDKLDRNCSYTIGFRHHDFHPLLDDPPAVWLIKATGDGCIIPPQSPIKTTMKPRLLLSTMQTRNNEALSRWRNRAGRPNVRPHYGYILRAKPGNNLPDIIMESELMKRIKRYIYDMPRNRKNNIGMDTIVELNAVDEMNRLDYACLRASLDVMSRCVFIELFPQLADKCAKWSDLQSDIVSKIMELSRNENNAHGSTVTDSTNACNDTTGDITGIIVKAFWSHIKKYTSINPLDPAARSIILDFITDTVYIDLYMALHNTA